MLENRMVTGGYAPDEKEWDGCWDCPECGYRAENMVKHDEPLRDCLDHVEDGDLRGYARKELEKLGNKVEEQFKEINDLKAINFKLEADYITAERKLLDARITLLALLEDMGKE